MCLGLVTDPKRYEPLFTLSRALSHSLPCSLSLSPVLSLSPQTLGIQNPPSTLDPRLTGASLGGGSSIPRAPSLDGLGSSPWCKEELTPR